MSTQDPDQIRADIARTRAELSDDVDALTDRVSPGRVVHRQTDRVRTGVRGLRDRVMGTASDLTSSGTSAVQGAAQSVGDRASGVGHAVTDLPERARSGTQGSPLAAGLVAFGAGLVVAALMPSTEQEQRAATALKESAQPLAEEVKSVASEAAQNLKEGAQDAATSVKERATQAASNVKEEGASAAQEVRGDAQGAAHAVRDSASGSS
ncbi:DUF3618 domain-containing protein [Cellulomonas fimi]|uniref:DUF3618 domain-containing protein n=1 Tax=Cellulomonas fimi (strain ATCC 484 / DSM 20113 / JCM 1341 / CCUG 24087 / LMG 16345 / NBRC 15513 / NCIMB 8980 / NCTC 7547 / NRS-133) TaxID=590998 RepID=F4H3B8_CELFA|nr:DUF3618 domain-containing protein [Cellulomonas fimi]AEE45339.1 hypothetical protein Celf_1204 [Cellulomonas fimi ATCC 484]NNH08180.1 DUF3618 domain-containing protein [Cellulomonas fimi]VEH29024.1 Protein of uncharacterised function (DUF3618) [Cellulomonas fimi]